MITGLAHVGIHVTDMQESLRFYVDCLGMEKIFELKNDQGGDWLIYVKMGERSFIELFYGGTQKRVVFWPKTMEEYAQLAKPQYDAIYHEICTHMCFEVDDIMAVYERVVEFGYNGVTGVPTKGLDHNYECFIEDPDGNLIELMQYTDEALQFNY